MPAGESARRRFADRKRVFRSRSTWAALSRSSLLRRFSRCRRLCSRPFRRIQNDPNSAWTKVYAFFQQFHGGDPYYELVFLSLIVLFTFFYITIIFNTDEVADNLRKHGGFIAGIRPGAPTAEYLNAILTRLTTVGAIYLAFVAFVPQLLLSGFKVARLPFIGTAVDDFMSATPGLNWIPTGLGYQFYFGGTSLLILVGVAMDTVAQIEAQLVMRNYEGFLGAVRSFADAEHKRFEQRDRGDKGNVQCSPLCPLRRLLLRIDE